MPDLHDLDHFDEGLPAMTSLPASEIRRRGDRMRRRRTTLVTAGGVLAAALAVGVPALALSGGSGDHGVGPVDTPSPSITPDTARTDWVTTVPADFPLTAGFPDKGATPAAGLSADANLVPVCDGADVDGFVDDRVVTHAGESEDRAVRVLALYPDDAAARAQVSALRTAIDGCDPQPIAQGTTAVYDTHTADLGTEESFAFTQQVLHDDGLLSDLTYVQVARTGNAIYLESHYGAPGGEDVIASVQELLTERSSAPLQSMCLFAAHPCVIEGEPATDSADSDIPGDFPLDQGMTTDSETEVTGPGRDVEGVSFGDVCQTDAWPGTATTDRLAVHEVGIEYGRTRELVTYESADDAVAAMTALSTDVEGCPESEDRVFQSFDADTGYESSLTFGFTYREGIGGTLFQVVRVGRSILATSASGDFLADSLGSGVPDETARNAAITALMCPWTEAGC